MNYKNLLLEIGDHQLVSPTIDTIIDPDKKQLYYVNLETRKITSPDRLSVESEHLAETIYFLVDRFYDNMDLAQTNCIIQYSTAIGNYVYVVPFCDIYTYPNQMIIPWTINAAATQCSGDIKYSMRFYLLDKDSFKYDNENHIELDSVNFLYSLSTLPASSKILKTLPLDALTDLDSELQAQANVYQVYIEELANLVKDSTLYWIDV